MAPLPLSVDLGSVRACGDVGVPVVVVGPPYTSAAAQASAVSML